VVDREGLRNTDSCVAYADGPQGGEHPATGAAWFVWETSRGQHFHDHSVTVSVPPDAPQELAAPAAVAAKRASPVLSPADSKRRRLDAACAAEARAMQHNASGSKGWLPRIFGGA